MDFNQIELGANLKCLKSSFIRKQGWCLQIMRVHIDQGSMLIPPEVQEVLSQFQTIFVEPVGLPP